MEAAQQTPSYRRYAIVGAIVLLITAWFSKGWHQCDEYYQILEFGSYKLGLTPAADLPWEFAARMRPAFQPLLVVGVYRLFQLFGSSNPFLISFVLRLLSATLFWSAVTLMLRTYRAVIRDQKLQQWYALLSYFLWIAVYDGVRFSSESWSGSFFTIGFALLMMDRSRVRTWSIVGVLFGLAFVVRFQTALLIAGIFGWALFVDKVSFKKISAALGGIVLAVVLGILIDHWFYGEWVLSQWNYFVENIVQGKAESFGVDPWYAYLLETIERGVPPTSVIYVLAPIILLVYARRDPLTWAAVPFVLGHMVIGHKELRFLFPLLGLMPVIIIRSLEMLITHRWPGLLEARGIRWSARFFWITNVIVLCVVMFKPADDQLYMYERLYHAYPDRAIFYHTGIDPFDRARPMHFYRRSEWELRGALSDTTRMTAGESFLVATITPKTVSARWPDARIVYRTLPEWTRHFNVNGWLDRTDQWFVMEVHP